MINISRFPGGYISLYVDDIRHLPELLKKLDAEGYDLGKCRKALDEIEEEQRQKQEDLQKRKTIAVRYARRAEALKAMPKNAARTFHIAYNQAKDDAKIYTAEGTVYSDGSVHSTASWPYFAAPDLDYLKENGESNGYECSIEFVD